VKKNTLMKLAFGALLLGPMVTFYVSGMSDHMTITSLKSNREMLHALVENNYLLAVCYYIGIYTLFGALSFPFVSLVTMAGGFLFGTLAGSLYTVIGATAGGSIAFLMYRTFFGSWVRDQYGHRLVTFNQEFARNGASYLVIMRLIAVIPFFVANALASVAPITLKTFMWTTAVGVMPSALIYSFAGQQLDTINTVGDVFSPKVIAAFALLGLLTFASLILQKFKTKK
jgi:uncharacterized membrane protein YdjX (TVP38/TMEM64 family)